jgi:hypothetical protein
MRKHAWLALALLFFSSVLMAGWTATPVAAAPAASLSVTSAKAIDGAVEGPLVGSLWERLYPEADAALGAWSVQAGHADATMERRDRALVVEGVSVLPNEDSATTASYTALSAVFTDVSGDARVLVLPAAPGSAVAVLQGSLEVKAGPAEDGTHPHRAADGAEPFVERAGQAIEVRPSRDGATVTVSGDLRLVVTGLRLAVASQEGPAVLDTRRSDEPADPSGIARRTSSVEAILDLRDAALVLPIDSLRLDEGLLAADAIDLRAADGDLVLRGHSYSLERDDVTVGGAAATLGREGGRLTAGIRGDVDALTIAGQAVALPSQAGHRPPAVVWPALLGFAAVTHVLLGRQVFRGIDDALGGQRYPEVLALARWLRLHPWLRQDTTLAVALSLSQLGRWQDARETLLRGTWAPARVPMRDFLLARAAARLGDRPEGFRRLASSLLADPGLLPQAKADPDLAHLLAAGLGPASVVPGVAGADAQGAYA